MPTTDEELARARLAWISAGQRPLSAPRRAFVDPGDGPAEEPAPPGAGEAASTPQTVRSDVREPWFGLVDLALRRRYVAAVLILLLVGIGITVAVLGSSQAVQVELEQTHPEVLVTEPAPEPSPEAVPVEIRVHVLGAVQNPGVVALTEGAIVADALAAAGGLRQDADPAELNLAARLTDGQQVIVGTAADPRGDVRDSHGGGDGDGAPGAGQVNLNTANQAQLETLPGVGPVMAGAIITWREDNGGFTSVADLQEVPGIGPKTFATLEPLVTV